jgi:hypothetical protein
MIELKFSTSELTVQEAFWIELAGQGLAVGARTDFIVARAENVADRNALIQQLLSSPYHELVRLFNDAMASALPATRAALDVVNQEFERRREASSDEDIGKMFADDLIG